MSIQLKIKLKYLAAEARFIRTEELKAKKWARKCSARQKPVWANEHHTLRQDLYEHRIGVVRPEARASHLAYGFLRGKQYTNIESSVRPGNEPDQHQVMRIVKSFAGQEKADEVEIWFGSTAE